MDAWDDVVAEGERLYERDQNVGLIAATWPQRNAEWRAWLTENGIAILSHLRQGQQDAKDAALHRELRRRLPNDRDCQVWIGRSGNGVMNPMLTAEQMDAALSAEGSAPK